MAPQGRRASRSVANALADQVAVPAIQAEMVLIQTIAGDEWRNDVTLGMLGWNWGHAGEGGRHAGVDPESGRRHVRAGIFTRTLAGMEREAVSQALAK